jgi:sugar phosphate isomerase/epimerase
MTLPLSLQLYTLRDHMATDFVGTLEQVSKIGYTAVEFAGYGGHTAEELSQILKEFNLKASSSHIPLKDLETQLEYLIEFNQKIGSKHIICPWIPKEHYNSKDSYQRLGDSLDKMGRICQQNGVTLAYHNHDFEFERFEGEFGLDILLANADPEHLKLELDVYWAEFAGVSAIDYMDKQASRCRLVHLKDMADTPEREFTELGNGTIDLESVINKSREIGVEWAIVEQDKCKRSPMDSVKISFDYLTNKGYI